MTGKQGTRPIISPKPPKQPEQISLHIKGMYCPGTVMTNSWAAKTAAAVVLQQQKQQKQQQ
jgi:hypothetical protein